MATRVVLAKAFRDELVSILREHAQKDVLSNFAIGLTRTQCIERIRAFLQRHEIKGKNAKEIELFVHFQKK